MDDDLKKLVDRHLADEDTRFEAEEFYALAMEPEFGNEMVFKMSNTDGRRDTTFSRKGVDGLVDQVHMFMMARIFAYWKEHGRPAKELAFGITMAFADGTEETDDSVLKELPNFIAEDSGGLTQLDGERRIPRKPLT